MNDSLTTINQLKNHVKRFVEDREWQRYHSPKNLSMQIACEASELLELFLWIDSHESHAEVEKKREAIEHEVADIMTALLGFCVQTNIDLTSAFEKKMALNAQKYPVEKAKGNCLKYTHL